MTLISHSSSHKNGSSYDSMLVNFKSNKIKFVYEAHNASERFSVELFDGTKWNHVLGLNDVGFERDNHIYIQEPHRRERRCIDMRKASIKILNKLLC